MSYLEVNRVSKHYKKNQVLQDVSLDVESGRTLVLFGPSGAGKTVLLRIIAGVVEPSDGTVFIDGEDMAPVEAEHRGVGMAFQNFALFPHMTAYDNIASPLTAEKLPASTIEERVQSVAKLLKIDHVLAQLPRALSNGQKQRTALSRALVGEPPLLLLDDPLRNVDAKLRFEMRLELPRLLSGRGATVVYVTQDYKEAMAMGDKIAVLNEGRIQQYGTPEDVYLRPATIEIARLFGDPVINLFDVTPNQGADGLFASLSGVDIPLPDLSEQIAGSECVLAVRPENLEFVDAKADNAIPVIVEAETPLNEKVITLAMTTGGREILLSRPAGAPGIASGNAHVAIKIDSTLMFDKATSKLLGSNSNESNRGEAA